MPDQTRPEWPPLARRQKVALAVSGVLLLGLVLVLTFVVYPWARWTEDFFPGRAPNEVLQPEAWTITDDSITFAVLGDNGSGGRNAMDVARQMARSYQQNPYGVVVLLGDISYYGGIVDRYQDVFRKPLGPLIDAGVEFELAIGNHEIEETPDSLPEVADKLAQFGLPNSYYKVTHGPIDFFILDSSLPLADLAGAQDQLAWLERELAASTATWQVAALHHQLYSSGEKRAPDPRVRELLEPIFIEHGIDIVFYGHDHFYERTKPQNGITYVLSGAGAKISRVGFSDFTAVAEEKLQFMLVDVAGDTMTVQAIDQNGAVFDEFTVSPR
ncbi:MAG: metallophosphoesterase family protein [Acidimicrobiia bacterium]